MQATRSKKNQLGDWTIWSLSDGYLDIDQRVLFDQAASVIQDQLRQGQVKLQEEFTVRTPVNAYLIDTGKHFVLVDAGCGGFLGPTTGLLMERLREVGCNADKITHLLITHLHVDHIGGLVDSQGGRAFPRATLYVPKADADFWTDPTEEAKSIDAFRPVFPLARQVLAAYRWKGKLQLIAPDAAIIPGLEVVAAFGHTVGHLAFRISSQDQSALLWGDLVHTASVQFKKPEWKLCIDTDPEEAVKSRHRLFVEAADQKLLVGGAHLPHPGFGCVSRQDDHFVWESLSK